MVLQLTFKPATAEQWSDLEILFGKRGACGGCWCMYWRLTNKQFEAQKGAANKRAMKQIITADQMPGILAYRDDQPVGWCAIAPREQYVRLSRSRILKPVDERPCWSVSCLFIDKQHRKKGVSTALLREAVSFAASRGATVVEGYPVEPKPDQHIPPAFAWTGIPAAFLKVGFKEVARRSATRPIMRIEL